MTLRRGARSEGRQALGPEQQDETIPEMTCDTLNEGDEGGRRFFPTTRTWR